MCQGVSNSVPPLYVIVEVLLCRCPKNLLNNIYTYIYIYFKAFAFYVAAVGKIVSVVLESINFNDPPLL